MKFKVLAKINEMAAEDCLTEHLYRNNLPTTDQSAFKPSHSTESALLHVIDDLISAIYKQQAVLLL